jgi:hypothetical protein
VVTDPEGKPVGGAQVAVFPSESRRWIKTGTNGDFSLSYTVRSWQTQQGGDLCLVVRHADRELAIAESFAPDTTNVTVQLKPAVTLTGQVNGPAGVPLADAKIGIWLFAVRTFSDLLEAPASTDMFGKFEIKNLPPDTEFTIYAKAKDHGGQQQKLAAEAGGKRVELPAFELKDADQIIAGKVVNTDDKPVSGARVSLSGDGQPDGAVTTDAKGRFQFKVCEGTIRVFASGQNGYANASAEPGDTNIVIQLSRSFSSVREAPRRAGLKGKPLPDLASLGLAAGTVPAGKPVLLCLLDAEQRPSRRAARLLAEQHDALRQKGVSVAVVQTQPGTSAETFQEWTNSSALPFPVGRVEKKTPDTRWATEVASLPWLILTDAEGKVSAEGFSVDELDAKLEALKK